MSFTVINSNVPLCSVPTINRLIGNYTTIRLSLNIEFADQ